MGAGGKRPGAGRKPHIEAPPKTHTRGKDARLESYEGLRTSDRLAVPKYLSPAAKKEWRRTMSLYKTMKTSVLMDLDIAALAMYCEAFAAWQETRRYYYDELGGAAYSVDPEKQKAIEKVMISMSKQVNIVSKLAEQLCLTPVGRARMGMQVAKAPGLDLLTFLKDDEDNE